MATHNIDIIIPCYNYGRFLEECLVAIAAQTRGDYQVLIMDNASEDDTPEVAARWMAKDPRIRYHRNVENLGAVGNMRLGYQMTSAEYVVILPADDLWQPAFLEATCNALDAHPECSYAYTGWHVSGGDAGAPQGAPQHCPHPQGGVVEDMPYLTIQNHIPLSFGVFRRSVCERVGGAYPLFLPMLGDLYLWMRLSSAGPSYYDIRNLGRLRFHGQNESNNLYLSGRSAFDHIHLLDLVFQGEEWPLSIRLLAKARQFQLLTGKTLAETAHGFGGETAPQFIREYVAGERDELFKLAAKAIRAWSGMAAGMTDVPSNADKLLDLIGPDTPTVQAGTGPKPVPAADAKLRIERFNDLYQQWLNTHLPDRHELQRARERIAASPTTGPEFCVVVDARTAPAAVDGTLAQLQSQTLAPRAVYILAESGMAPATSSAATEWVTPETLRARLERWNGRDQWILTLQAGDLLVENALQLAQSAIADADAPLLLYFDHDEIAESGRFENPHFKPDANPDLLRSYPYTGRALLLKGEWLARHSALIPLNVVAAYECALGAMEDGGSGALLHVPRVLAHLTPRVATVWADTPETAEALASVLGAHARRTLPGSVIHEGPVPGTFHWIPPLYRQPLISIIVPTKDQVHLLRRCLESVFDKNDYPNFEIIVVDNDSQTPEARRYIASLESGTADKIRVLRYPGAFNFAAMNNRAAAMARGEFLLLLNNDTAAIQANWLSHMVRHALREEVGIVGAALFFPDGRIQHAGVVLGLHGAAGHPFTGLSADTPGYLHRAQVQQDYSAVTGACLMVRKSLYEEVGGLDEETFAVNFNDIDLCLKVRDHGNLVVWTPLAMLLHETSASQLSNTEQLADELKNARFAAESAALRARWEHVIANDPAYNRNLTLSGEAFTLNMESPIGAKSRVPTSSREREEDEASAIKPERPRQAEQPSHSGAMAGSISPPAPLPQQLALARNHASIDRPIDPDDGNRWPQRAATERLSDSYRVWRDRRRLLPTDFALLTRRMNDTRPQQPSVHLIIRVARTQFPLLARTLDSLNAQLYGSWHADVISTEPSPGAELTGVARLAWHEVAAAGEMKTTIDLLVSARGSDWVCELPPGAELDPMCLFRVAHDGSRGSADGGPAAYFVDDDIADSSGGRHAPRFKPALDPDWMRCTDLLGPLFVDAPAWREIGGAAADPTRPWYDLALRVVDAFGPDAVGHIAEPLISLPETLVDDGHWTTCMAAVRRSLARRKIAGKVVKATEDVWRVEYPLRSAPMVTVAIPSRDKPEYLAPCVDLLLSQTVYPDYEILIVDANSQDRDTLRLLEQLSTRTEAPVRVVTASGQVDPASYANVAAREGHGDLIVFLSDDVRITRGDWLNGLVRHILRDDVACVGPMLVSPPEGIVGSSGMILGMGGFADGPHQSEARSGDPGYLNCLLADRTVDALPAACLLVRRSEFLAAGGMDAARLSVAHADLDLCLRLTQSGRRCVLASSVSLIKIGGACIDPIPSWPTESARREVDRLTAQEAVLRGSFDRFTSDRRWSKHLDRLATEPRIETRCVPIWHAVPLEAPRILAFPVLNAQGDIRVTRPLQALRSAGKALPCIYQPNPGDSAVPSVYDLARHEFDTIVAHQLIGQSSLVGIRQWRSFLKDVFMVYSVDDLLTDMPLKSSLRQGIAADARTYLAGALRHCDRLVVSTAFLAESYGHLASDTRIVPNRLEADRWLPLKSTRGTGPRPRVGWAGGTAHEGDLQMIAEVVAATAKEVDWIFMGMCPENIRPYVKEFHPFGDFDAYPARLAALNLDIAVAPLEQIPFNRGKSNLRLLEYGALGIPVVCTDIDPYRDSPACKVGNRPGEWLDALRERIYDPEAATREGEAMRQWVLAHYILEDHLDDWLRAHLPG